MIRGILSVTGAVILMILLFRVIQGEMSLIDVAVRGLVIMVCISLADKVLAPTLGAALRGLKAEDSEDGESVDPSPTGA